jgi:hypothetical protein
LKQQLSLPNTQNDYAAVAGGEETWGAKQK